MQFHRLPIKILALVLLATPFASAISCQFFGNAGCEAHCLELGHLNGHCNDDQICVCS
ncbi:hypothetical protein BYT27DRAFT_7194844 [Phlegmacium glaucopus]|nr:hypothetical protein BYT27DRAFT_7194844 [Phlegmacium glaucopus]